MFCSKCGNKLNDNDKFCSKCGAQVGTQSGVQAGVSMLTSSLLDLKKVVETKLNGQEQTETQYDKTQYTVFEEFNYKPLLGGKKCFIITDHSIIHDNTEYPFSQLTVIDIPKGQFVVHNPQTTTIDGKVIELLVEPVQEEIERFMSVAIRANQKIKLNSLKEKLIYANTLYNCGSNFQSHSYSPTGKMLDSVPLDLYMYELSEDEQEKIYPEIRNRCQAIDKTKIKELPEYEQNIINEYIYTQELLNDFYAENNILSKENRISTTKVFIEYLSESDTDANAAANKHFEKVRQEREKEALETLRRREENEARRAMGLEEEPSSSGSGFLSGMLSTAAGVALGNKMSSGRKKEKQSYFSSGPKKDLYGSAICQRSRGKNYCLGCSAYDKCTQQWY